MTTHRSGDIRSRINRALLWLLPLAAAVGCHDANRYVLTSEESIPVEQLFELTVDGDTSLRADGFSSVQLVAQVKDISEGGRTVLFTTTAGSLRVGGRTRTDSLLVGTDKEGAATIRLVSPPTSADALVIATIMDVTPALVQQQHISFTTVTADDILTFDALPDTVAVGTESQTAVRVRIDPGLEGEDRRVAFTTSLGSFQFGSGEEKQTRSVLAGEDGIAEVVLMGPDAGGEALVTATVRGYTQEETIRFISEPSVTFLEAPTLAPADGFTLTRFTVAIGSASGNPERSVEFVTTAGTLVSGDDEGRRVVVQAGGQDTTGIYLRSPREVVVAVVSASLSGASDERPIRFELAPPDSVVVSIESGTFRLPPDGQTAVSAFLLRGVGRGKVTNGLDVSFDAADSLGNRIPLARFFNVTPADTNGIATAVFTPDGSGFRGLVTITATYSDDEVTVQGAANVRIVTE